MNKYIELSVETNPIWAECLSEILISDIGCFGIVSNEIEYKDEQVIKDNNNIVKAYLWFKEPNRPNVEQIQSVIWEKKSNISKVLPNPDDVGSWNISVKDIEDEDWAHNWKKYWHVQKIGQRTVICPSWEVYEPNDNEIFISLDPGTAFGTGTHPSTRLCLMGLEKYMQPNFKVADIGTGSGVLAIAAAKLHAKSVVGVDNDPSVIDVAIDNANKNNVSSICNFYAGSAEDVKGEYDIVIVNILAEVIVSILSDIVKLAKPQAKFIFSGIIDLKEQYVIDNAKAIGLTIVDGYREKEDPQWVGIVAQK